MIALQVAFQSNSSFFLAFETVASLHDHVEVGMNLYRILDVRIIHVFGCAALCAILGIIVFFLRRFGGRKLLDIKSVDFPLHMRLLVCFLARSSFLCHQVMQDAMLLQELIALAREALDSEDAGDLRDRQRRHLHFLLFDLRLVFILCLCCCVLSLKLHAEFGLAGSSIFVFFLNPG